MSIYINHSTNDISTNAGARVTSGGNTVITTNEAATDAAAGIVELATSAEVQTGTDTGRVPSVSSLRGGLLVSGTAIATTSGTSHNFTGIPSWVKRITVMFDGVSTSGTASKMIQIGTAGGFEVTGYQSSAANITTSAVGATTSTTAFILDGVSVAASLNSGSAVLTNLTGNTWSFTFNLCGTNANILHFGAGSKTLAGALTQLRITTNGGTDTFDAGSVNIIYE